MSPFLRALAWVAPKAALSRAAAFDALRAYEGAKRGRRQASLGGRGTSANAEIGQALKALRDRSRDLVQNTSIGARTLDVLTGHVVGTGIHVSWQTGTDQTDKVLKETWQEWCRHSDLEGENNFAAQQSLAVRSMLEGGDCVGYFGDANVGPRRQVKMRLKLYEGDFVDESRNGPIYGGRARLGVGLGDLDVRTGLWMFSEHPGEASLGSGAARSTFVPRSNLIHLYRPLRIGQVRGVPVFAPVLMAARDYADLMDALVVKARVEACQALVVTRPEGAGTLAGSTVDDGSGPIEKVRPGTVLYLNPGEQASSFNPASSGGYDQVQIQTLMGIASGAMVTYDQLTGDLRQANYSSLRAGKIEFRRIVEQLQWLVVVPKLIEPVVERFLDRAKLAGIIDRLPQGCGCQFVMPAVEPIDPEKDLKADILAVRAGRMSPQEFISGWGRDWREVVDDMEAFFKVADEKGLIFDLDPRKVSAAGILQRDPAAAAPAAP